MCKRQNESSQIKREDYAKQTATDYDVRASFMNSGLLHFERANEEQLNSRQIVRARRVVNRNQQSK